MEEVTLNVEATVRVYRVSLESEELEFSVHVDSEDDINVEITSPFEDILDIIGSGNVRDWLASQRD